MTSIPSDASLRRNLSLMRWMSEYRKVCEDSRYLRRKERNREWPIQSKGELSTPFVHDSPPPVAEPPEPSQPQQSLHHHIPSTSPLGIASAAITSLFIIPSIFDKGSSFVQSIIIGRNRSYTSTATSSTRPLFFTLPNSSYAIAFVNTFDDRTAVIVVESHGVQKKAI